MASKSKELKKITSLLLVIFFSLHAIDSFADGLREITVNDSLHKLAQNVEAVLRSGEPDINELLNLVKNNDPIKILKLVSFSRHADTKTILKLNEASLNYLMKKMNSPSESLFMRYKIFEYLTGYLDAELKIDHVFNFNNILKMLYDLSTQDFEAAQHSVHGAYFIFRFAYLSNDLSREQVTGIKNIVQYAIKNLAMLNTQLVAPNGREEDLYSLHHKISVKELIKESFSELLKEHDVAPQARVSIDGVEYLLDQRTGVVKAFVKSDDDVDKITRYWGGGAFEKLNGARGWVIINAILPLMYNFYVNSFLIQPDFAPNFSANYSIGPNCYNTSALYHDSSKPIKFFEIYELNEFIQANMTKINIRRNEELQPGDVVVYYSDTLVKLPIIDQFSEVPMYSQTAPSYLENLDLVFLPLHSAIYLIGGFTFSKSNYLFSSPYTIKHLEEENCFKKNNTAGMHREITYYR